MQIKWPEPAWVAELSEEERLPALRRFYLRLAANYNTPKGNLTTLSESCGMNASALNVFIGRGYIPPTLAVKLESVLGRDLFPRELFNDIFVIKE